MSRARLPLALLVTWLAACRTVHEVRLPPAARPAAGIEAYRALRIGAMALDGPKSIDAPAEARGFFAGEIRNRTRLEVLRAAGDLPARPGTRVLVLEGRGRFEETTVGASGTTDIERQTIVPALEPPNRKARWAHAYRLVLDLTLRDEVSGETLWTHSYRSDLEPRKHSRAAFALYELLEPMAVSLSATLGALGGGEPRRILVP